MGSRLCHIHNAAKHFIQDTFINSDYKRVCSQFTYDFTMQNTKTVFFSSLLSTNTHKHAYTDGGDGYTVDLAQLSWQSAQNGAKRKKIKRHHHATLYQNSLPRESKGGGEAYFTQFESTQKDKKIKDWKVR